MMNRTNIVRIVALSGLASTLLTLAACQVIRRPDGTIEVRESVQPTQDGIYNRIEIGGKCYLSNGIWCIPCEGGKALNCDEVRRVLGDKPWQGGTSSKKGKAVLTSSREHLEYYGYNIYGDSSIEPSETMMWSVEALTGGMAADEVASKFALSRWKSNAEHSSVFSLNSFDSGAETIDITYLSAWGANAPIPGTYSNGVHVEYYHLGGDPNDGRADAVAVRISGPIEAVATVISDEIEQFNGSIATEYGDFKVRINQGQGNLTWNGAVVWTR
jgi:hypothetical protein